MTAAEKHNRTTSPEAGQIVAGVQPTQATTAPIDVVVNGKRVATAAQTLAQLVTERDLGEAKVATALNGDFVPAGRRCETELHAGDAIEIVAPRQGG